MAYRARISATCGLGMNLYVTPRGECFPCYALIQKEHMLGNAIECGILSVLSSDRYVHFAIYAADFARCGAVPVT